MVQELYGNILFLPEPLVRYRRRRERLATALRAGDQSLRKAGRSRRLAYELSSVMVLHLRKNQGSRHRRFGFFVDIRLVGGGLTRRVNPLLECGGFLHIRRHRLTNTVVAESINAHGSNVAVVSLVALLAVQC